MVKGGIYNTRLEQAPIARGQGGIHHTPKAGAYRMKVEGICPDLKPIARGRGECRWHAVIVTPPVTALRVTTRGGGDNTGTLFWGCARQGKACVRVTRLQG
eukprot:468335-Prorocentrum_minimum.AAC.1